MAREDEALPIQSGILDPLVGMGFFSPNMSLEEIKRRRAIGAALASRARPFPKTIGEGMTALGEALGERWAEERLAAAEKGYLAKRDADMPGAVPPVAPVPRPVAEVLPEVTPPAVAAAPAPAIARPSPLPPAPAGPMAGTAPAANRDDITRALAMRNPAMADMIAQIGGQGAPPPGPMVTANASLAPSPTVGAPGAGAAPDGETFAEEGGPNPPTISRDIRPMLVAEAAGPRPTAPPFGLRAPDISVRKPITRPPEPEMEPAGKEERAWEAYRQKYINDEDVVKRATSAIEPYKQKRLQDYAEKRKEWELKYTDYLKQEADERAYERGLPKAQQDYDKEQLEIAKKREEAATRAQWGNLPSEVQKDLFASRDAAKAAASSIGALNNAEAVLDAGTAIGPGSALAQAWHKTRAFAGNKESERILANTQTFQASLGPAVMAAVKSYGGPQVSNTDREYAAAMTGSDVTLTEPAVRKILDIARRSAKAAMEEHRAKADEHAKDAPSLRKFLEVADPLAASPKMSEGAKPAATAPVAGGKYNEGDIARGKPGQPDLIRRGGKWVPL